jgi:hypothetical protein
MESVISLIILFGAGYLISLRLHPFRRCPACSGTGRHRGGIFTYSHRRCRRCGGGGRQERLGASLGLGGKGQELPGRGRGGA